MPRSALPVVISPWLPTAAIPYAGTFVLDFARCLREIYIQNPTLVHLDDTFRAESSLSGLVARKFVARSLARHDPLRPLRLLRVPVPVPRGSDWVVRARAAREVGGALDRLPSALGHREPGSKVDIHAHVGIMSGSAVDRFASAHNLIVYEHSSFIVPLLKSNSDARRFYGTTVRASRRVLCVNGRMATDLSEIYPNQSHKFLVHPNVVDFGRFPFLPREGPLRRWLYMGNLKPSKGSRRLISAFQSAMRRWGDVSLTVAGSGVDIQWLGEQCVGERFRVLPPIPPSRVPELMAGSDLLVHLSEGETFGLTAIEAIASGMPVLLTSTDGSEMVIRPLVERVGSIISQDASPEDIVDAYEELRDHPARLDLASGRAELESRYSPQAITSLLVERLIEIDSGET